VSLLQSGTPPVNDHLVELLVMINAAPSRFGRPGHGRAPLYPYARQDKKSAPREPISTRLVATLLEAAGADRVMTMDLHTGQIQGFFAIPVDHMTALPLFADHYRRRGLSGEAVVSVSPDLGRVKAARRFAEMLDASFAVVTKVRPAHERAVAAEVIGEVADKTAILGDDMIVTGGTLVAAAEALLEAGAKAVHAFATHGLFTPAAVARLGASELREIAVTDTVTLDPVSLPGKVTIVTAADLLADSIRNVFAGRSVSALFGGENELF
jgi:ribose-phosphate pyrophosphokinase